MSAPAIEEPLFVRSLQTVPAYMPQDEAAGVERFIDVPLGAGAHCPSGHVSGEMPHFVFGDRHAEVSVTLDGMAPDEAVAFADKFAREAQRFADAVRLYGRAGR